MQKTSLLVALSFFSCGPLKDFIDEDKADENVINRVPLMATAISGTCAILETGQLKCWGDNSVGQLGKGNTENLGDKPDQMGDNLQPVDLGIDRTVRSVSSSTGVTCAILDNSHLKCWGGNSKGTLGQGHTNNIGDLPDQMGDNLRPIDLGTGKYALSVAVNGSNACAILNDSTLKCWGDGQAGQTGQGSAFWIGDEPGQMGDNLSPIDLGTGRTAIQVSVGGQHICALLDNGTVKCWGFTGLGQGVDTAIGNLPGQMGDNLMPIDLGSEFKVTMIATGSSHSCALLSDGSVKCWGINSYGQLGLGNTNHVGEEPGQMGDNLPPIDLGLNKTAKKIFAGTFTTCALLNDGIAKCWGYLPTNPVFSESIISGDEPNEMGDNLIPLSFGSGKSVVDISITTSNICALLNDQSIKCWGKGSDGANGQENADFIPQKVDSLGENLAPINLGTKPAGE